MCRHYNVGDRIFYEHHLSGEICTGTVKKIKEYSYIDNKGKKIQYKWLVLWEGGNVCYGIEDYNCLPYSDNRVKELAKKYKQFDNEKGKIMDSIIGILSPYDKLMQMEIIDMLKIKLGIG